jgi:hypothetical protein
MALHHPAHTVISPRDCVSNIVPIYDGGPISGEYSVAILEWNGDPCVGIRWNITERELNDADKVSGAKICVGEPNSRGYATWFILPDDFLRDLLSGGHIATKIKDYLKELK